MGSYQYNGQINILDYGSKSIKLQLGDRLKAVRPVISNGIH